MSRRGLLFAGLQAFEPQLLLQQFFEVASLSGGDRHIVNVDYLRGGLALILGAGRGVLAASSSVLESVQVLLLEDRGVGALRHVVVPE